MPLAESSLCRQMSAVKSLTAKRTNKLSGLGDNTRKPRKAGFIVEDKQHVVLSHRLRRRRVGTKKKREKEEKQREGGGDKLLPNGSFCTDHKGKDRTEM